MCWPLFLSVQTSTFDPLTECLHWLPWHLPLARLLHHNMSGVYVNREVCCHHVRLKVHPENHYCLRSQALGIHLTCPRICAAGPDTVQTRMDLVKVESAVIPHVTNGHGKIIWTQSGILSPAASVLRILDLNCLTSRWTADLKCQTPCTLYMWQGPTKPLLLPILVCIRPLVDGNTLWCMCGS